MLPWLLLDTAKVPGGTGDLRLMKRGAEFAIMAGSNPLMTSRLSGSEKALATLVCERLRTPNPKILIGGLGMGFTLRAALEVLGADAEVAVAELVPAVIAWAHGPMSEIFGTSLGDPRVRIIEGDVGSVIMAAPNAYDAILLDVDNGPGGVTRSANDGLYSTAGLAAARSALRPGGLYAVWSSSPNRSFTSRLRQSGFQVEEVTARAHGKTGIRHLIWIAKKQDTIASARMRGNR